MRSQEELAKLRQVILSNNDLINSLLKDEQIDAWADRTLSRISGEQNKGLSEREVSESLGLSISNLRALRAINLENERKESFEKAVRYQDMGLTISEIAKLMDKSESTIRFLLRPDRREIPEGKVVAEVLRSHVDADRYVDVGRGTEVILKCKKSVLEAALIILKEKGYKVQHIRVKKIGSGQMQVVKVLTTPDVDSTELYSNRDKISHVSV